MTAILGISAYYHDSAAALVVDGAIVGAAQEERFTRKKHDAGFPANAISYCLEEAGISFELGLMAGLGTGAVLHLVQPAVPGHVQLHVELLTLTMEDGRQIQEVRRILGRPGRISAAA